MLNLAYTYKLQPSKKQIEIIDHNLAVCKSVWNHALNIRKLWYNSRKCDINKCSIISEYVIEPFEYPNYHTFAYPPRSCCGNRCRYCQYAIDF
ncbi:MAG: helix-turn-helix domain-containing protein [Xenococcaceae cyanobacterium]